MRFCAGVGDLEGGAPGVEDHHARVAVTLEGGLLRQTEDVPVEPDRILVVVRLDHQPQLAHRALVTFGLHASSLLGGTAVRRRPRDVGHHAHRAATVAQVLHPLVPGAATLSAAEQVGTRLVSETS